MVNHTARIVAALVAALLFAAPTLAAPVETSASVVAINNQTLAVARTSSTLSVFGWGTAKFQVRYTYHTGTRLTFLFEESDDGTTWSYVTKTNADDVTSKFQPYYDLSAASVNLTLLLDVVGLTYLRVTVTGTGTDATDFITVHARPARGQ
jgi:hypothetical protein